MKRPAKSLAVVKCSECDFHSVPRMPSGFFPDGSEWWPWLHYEDGTKAACIGSFMEAESIPHDQALRMLGVDA